MKLMAASFIISVFIIYIFLYICGYSHIIVIGLPVIIFLTTLPILLLNNVLIVGEINLADILKAGLSIIMFSIVAYFAFTELKIISSQISSNNKILMNERYREIYSNFYKLNDSKENEDVKHNIARQYFNLWDSELDLHLKGELTDDFMHMINHGACVNFMVYPFLEKSFIYWEEKRAFNHSPNLAKYIREVIKKADSEDCSFSKKESRNIIPES